LKGVFRGVFVAQDPAADTKDHRPVAFDQGREGCFCPDSSSRREPLEQLPVCQAGDHPQLK
jgi:hypothetical protein